MRLRRCCIGSVGAMEGRLQIGQLADRVGVNPRTIRYYERIGLLPEPQRTDAGYRLYAAGDEDRLRFIKSAQRLGFTLGEVKETLACRERGERACPYVAGVIDDRLAQVDERMRELRRFKRELRELRDRMDVGGPDEAEAPFCHYIEASAPTSAGQPLARTG